MEAARTPILENAGGRLTGLPEKAGLAIVCWCSAWVPSKDFCLRLPHPTTTPRPGLSEYRTLSPPAPPRAPCPPADSGL